MGQPKTTEHCSINRRVGAVKFWVGLFGLATTVLACATTPVRPTPPPAPIPLSPAEAKRVSALEQSDPDLSLVLERTLEQRNLARQRGDEASAAALQSAADALLYSVQRLRIAQNQWLECNEDRDTLSSLLGNVISKIPEKGPVDPAAAPSRPKTRATVSTDDTLRADLDRRLRAIARRIDKDENQTAGPAARTRLEHARQTVLDATRSATKGMYAHAERLADQAEALLASNTPPPGGLDDALRSDARRILGDRTRLVDSGILVQLAERELEREDQQLVDDLTRLLTVYSKHPVSVLGAKDNSMAGKMLQSILERTRTKNRASRTPKLPRMDGTWLWIGFAS